MKTLGLLAAALLMAAPCVCSAEALQTVARPAALVQAENNAGMELYDMAYESYVLAKSSTDRIQSGEHYARAIASIAKANAAEPDCVEYLALSMQAYRGKGVLAYAKSSFIKAERVLQFRLEANPNDFEALIDYAVLCYAGDVAYSSEADVYKVRAEGMAQRIMQLTERADSFDKLRVRGLAQLMLGKVDDFKRTMYQLPIVKADLDDKDKENVKVTENSAVEGAEPADKMNVVKTAEKNAAIIEAEAVYDEGSENAHFVKLYEETVEAGKWLWPTASSYLIREYMLYSLRDFTR